MNTLDADGNPLSPEEIEVIKELQASRDAQATAQRDGHGDDSVVDDIMQEEITDPVKLKKAIDGLVC